MDESTLSLGVVLALAFIAVIILVIFFQFIPFGLWLTAPFSSLARKSSAFWRSFSSARIS